MRHRYFLLAWIALALFCLLMAAQLASAAEERAVIGRLCGPMPDMLARFQTRFDETPLLTLRAGDIVFVLIRSDRGSWSLIRVLGETGCLVAAGRQSEIDRGI